MSVDRAPIKRPSVAGIVGDSHSRVRNIEAGQTMPYCYGQVYYNWAPNTTPPGYFENSTTVFVIRLSPESGYDPTNPEDDSVTFDTTDNSILTNAVPPTVQDDGGCIFVRSGGLFYWEAQLTASFEWTGKSWLKPAGIRMAPPYSVTGIDDPSFGAATYAVDDVLVQGGTFSVDGTLSGYTQGGSQGPVQGNQLQAYVEKVNAADEGFVALSIMCARWTPVGFAHWGSD